MWDEALVVGVGPAFGPHYGFYEVQSGLDGFEAFDVVGFLADLAFEELFEEDGDGVEQGFGVAVWEALLEEVVFLFFVPDDY